MDQAVGCARHPGYPRVSAASVPALETAFLRVAAGYGQANGAGVCRKKGGGVNEQERGEASKRAAACVVCPKCGAAVEAPCSGVREWPHASRVKLARALTNT